MSTIKEPGELFDEWAGDERAGAMGDHHWPMVSQALERVAPSSGAYLEIGLGTGYALEHMATHQFAEGRCVGIDISPRMVALARERTARLANVTIERADFAVDDLSHLGPFALIFSMEVLYYLDDVQAGLDRAAALLAPGGTLMVMNDYLAENPSTHDWPEQLGTRMTLWSRDDYRAGLERAGLAQVEQQHFTTPRRRAKHPEDAGTLCTMGRKP